jgi:hypothetical protein
MLEASEPEAKPIVTFDIMVIKACSLMFCRMVSNVDIGYGYACQLTK